LWRYNLHYFDDLNAEDWRERVEWQRTLILRWVRENPPGHGTGWESYPTSLRTVNWIKWAMSGNALATECAVSLALQFRWLARRLELHLLANHLFANAKALIFGGLFFQGPEAEAWFERGMRILKMEVNEQILRDGGQFERSTMYQCLALEDMLDLVNAFRAFDDVVPTRWRATIDEWNERIRRMQNWLVTMCHPDGDIAYFNDAAVGVAPSPAELHAYAGRLGFPSPDQKHASFVWLSDSGYIRVEQQGAVALLDVAPIGPDYMPGHGHADTLSFEMSLFGQRVFVNSGTSCYGRSAERLRQRGTAAHNTVIIEGENSSEIWDGFRVARRAHPVGLTVVRNHGTTVSCAHDGYRRLPGRPEHSRQWLFQGTEMLITDRVSGRFSRASARFHLHPAVRLTTDALESARTSEVIMELTGGRKIRFAVEGAELRCERTTWHPEFGRSEPNFCLVADLRDSCLSTRVSWDGVA
jgi:uncharacterized heparinase superfamily protein